MSARWSLSWSFALAALSAMVCATVNPGGRERITLEAFGSEVEHIGLYANPFHVGDVTCESEVPNLTRAYLELKGYRVSDLRAAVGDPTMPEGTKDRLLARAAQAAGAQALLVVDCRWSRGTRHALPRGELGFRMRRVPGLGEVFSHRFAEGALTWPIPSPPAESRSGIRRYRVESSTFLVERGIARALGPLPTGPLRAFAVGEEEVKLPQGAAPRVLPLVVVGDEEFTEDHRWGARVRQRVAFASAAFARQFGIRLRVASAGLWFSDDDVTTMDGLLKRLREAVPADSTIVVGFTAQETLEAFGEERDKAGLAYLLGDHLLIRDLGSPDADWGIINEGLTLVHELGHILGAVHVHDPLSIMNGHLATMTADFDAYNRAIVAVTRYRSVGAIARWRGLGFDPGALVALYQERAVDDPAVQAVVDALTQFLGPGRRP